MKWFVPFFAFIGLISYGAPTWVVLGATIAAVVFVAKVGTPRRAGGEAAHAAAQEEGRPRAAISEGRHIAADVNMFDVPQLMDQGRWDEARMAMQRLAYGMVNPPPDQAPHVKERFAALATEFARRDPLYSSAMGLIKVLVAQQPGLRQTEIYASLPSMTTEEARYVLYFGELLGDVQRRKRGNSYELFPAGVELPPAATKRQKRA